MAKFKAGELVRVKGHDIVMTVHEDRVYSEKDDCYNTVECIWFDTHNIIQTENFNYKVLEKVI